MLRKARTIRVDTWFLSRSMAILDGGRGIPGTGWPPDRPAPARWLLASTGNAEQAKIGRDWYRREPGLEIPIHRASHGLNRARVDVQHVSDELDQIARLIQAHRSRPQVARHGDRRSIATPVYFVVISILAALEGFLNLAAVPVLGAARFQAAFALLLGMAMFLVAHELGTAIKARQTDEPHPTPTTLMIALGLGGAAIMAALAELRAAALRIAIAEATTALSMQSSGHTGGSPTIVHIPSVPWPIYVFLMAAGFIAAIEAARRHHHWLADDSDHLDRAHRVTTRHLEHRLDAERDAAVEVDAARARYAGAFAETLARSDEARWWNIAVQHRYDFWNLQKRAGDPHYSLVTEPLPVKDFGWRQAPDPSSRVGSTQYPRTDVLWPNGFSFPAPAADPAGASPKDIGAGTWWLGTRGEVSVDDAQV